MIINCIDEVTMHDSGSKILRSKPKSSMVKGIELLKDNKANILTNSQVVTLNGHEARIDMVDEIPYLAQSGGASGNMQVLKEVVGIRLKILPTVNSDGYITTDITPEVS